MAKKKKKEIIMARRSQGDIVRLPSDDYPDCDIIVDYIENNYDDSIEGCMIAEGYKIAAVLIHDDKKDSRNDKWDFIVFDIVKNLGEEVQTITLDNIDSLEEALGEDGEEKLEVIKKITGYYEEIIQESVTIIRKYKGEGS
jgi:hypothetical protein